MPSDNYCKRVGSDYVCTAPDLQAQCFAFAQRGIGLRGWCRDRYPCWAISKKGYTCASTAARAQADREAANG